ncbi:MAG: NAD-glutamate dehydrogenase, partial [Actinomycetota bacterium]|nr:NAD-glutamate dehydrogenase [Actinomycetota bacterium]
MGGRGVVEPSAGDRVSDRGLAGITEQLGRVARSPLVVEFARAVLRRVPRELLEAADPLATAAALADAFAFVDDRRPGEIGVRVVDPETTLDGRVPGGTVIDVICEDRQFIVASVKEELHRLGHEAVRAHHPVLGCERGADGRLTAVQAVRGAVHRESFLRVELGGRVHPAGRPALIEAITRVLDDVFAITGDHDAMRDRITAVAAEARANGGLRYAADEVGEAADLLDWILEGNFVLSGCCDFPATPPGAETAGDHGPAVGALGILARPDAPLLQQPIEVDSEQLLHFAGTPEVSTVYRQVPMHCIDVVRVAPSGEVIGTFRVVGLLSHAANAEPRATTPVVGYKLHRILELEDVLEGGQDEAALVSLFQALPTDELLQADVPTLRRTLVELMAAEHEHDVRALLRVDPGNRLVSALISMPSELYSSALRRRLERFLMVQLDGIRVDADVSLADRPEAIIRLVVHVGGPVPEQIGALEREVRLLCRTWDQELAVALGARVGEERASQLTQLGADLFTAPYRDATKPHRSVDDLLHLEALLQGGPGEGGDGIRIVLAADVDGRAQARLKVFSARAGVELSQFLPIIESLGLWAVEDVPYVLGGGRVHLHDFGVRDPSGDAFDVEGDGPRLAEAAVALWHGRADADPLNRLVLRSAMSWQDVAVLRAYLRYRRQAGTAFTNDYVAQVLTENAATARAIVDLFAARFDPALDAGPEAVAEFRTQIIDSCDAVSLLDHDRILRGFLALVDATVRTNRYVAGSAHLALKFQSAGVPELPRPVPYREIFVHGPAVDGIHLRWGPVARGGIRWSDRPDDYRTEVSTSC